MHRSLSKLRISSLKMKKGQMDLLAVAFPTPSTVASQRCKEQKFQIRNFRVVYNIKYLNCLT